MDCLELGGDDGEVDFIRRVATAGAGVLGFSCRSCSLFLRLKS